MSQPDQISDRIRLAEAMGLPECYVNKAGMVMYRPPSDRSVWQVFEPHIDANDDYAVLEWMRDKYWQAGEPAHTSPMYGALASRFGDSGPFLAFHYELGDYARAALKVIGASSTETDDE